jgi:hypothetical protein
MEDVMITYNVKEIINKDLNDDELKEIINKKLINIINLLELEINNNE